MYVLSPAWNSFDQAGTSRDGLPSGFLHENPITYFQNPRQMAQGSPLPLGDALTAEITPLLLEDDRRICRATPRSTQDVFLCLR